jgi:hypothetical protein
MCTLDSYVRPHTMLSHLPYELLARIASFLMYEQEFCRKTRADRESGDTVRAYTQKFLNNLSLVNKTFYHICSRHRFSTYSLIFRASDSKKSSDTPFSGLSDHVPRSQWVPEENTLRIAHMTSKAQFIRELYIKDCGTEDIPVLPSSVLPELCEALKSLTR